MTGRTRYKGLVVALVLSIFSSAACSAPSFAVEPFEIPATGELYEVALGPSDSPTTPIEVYFVSSGSVSLAVGLVVEGPPGTKAVVDSINLPSGVSSYSEAIGRGVVPEPSTLASLTDAKGRPTDSFIIDPAGSGGRVQLLYHLHKNACLPDKSTRYVSRITLLLNEIAPKYFADGFKLRMAVKEHRYSGSEVASIKPVAEGKYRGEPILLMGTIQYGNEYVNLIRRAGQQVRSRRRLPVVKYVYHRGHSLSLARLRGLLNGGKATFELSNGGYIYGVCFNLARRRQTANNYPL
jgi:hypothetical protein